MNQHSYWLHGDFSSSKLSNVGIILLKTKEQVKRKSKKIRKKRGKSSENFYCKGRNFSSFIEALMEKVY